MKRQAIMDKGSRPSVMNEKQYEALKNEGMSKEKAARIANTPDAGKKGGALQSLMKSALKRSCTSRLKI